MFQRVLFAAALLLAAPALADHHEEAAEVPASQPASQPADAEAPEGEPTEDAEPVDEVEPAEIDTTALLELMEAGDVTICDVNNDSVRERVGVIPGALLLSDYEFPLEEVEATDNPVVFYCYNPRCGASHMAANWAMEHGFADARVYKPGIIGWVDDGQEVATFSP